MTLTYVFSKGATKDLLRIRERYRQFRHVELTNEEIVESALAMMATSYHMLNRKALEAAKTSANDTMLGQGYTKG